MIGCGLALPFAARAQSATSDTGIAALAWTATGELPTERGLSRLQMETQVEPWVRARTRSWFESEGAQSARTLIVEPDGAAVEIGGTRRPLPPRQAAHERAQYGLYGYLIEQSMAALPQPRRVHRTHAGLPPIEFGVDRHGTIHEALYRVPDPFTEGSIAQRIVFEQLVGDQGLEFPRILTFLADGKLRFRITIDRFTVRLA